MIPPILASIRIGDSRCWWLPLILLWPLLPLAFVIALPVAMLMFPRRPYAAACGTLAGYSCLCALRGLRVVVSDRVSLHIH